MNSLLLLILFLMPNGKSTQYYHSLVLTASDPYILERCIDSSIVRQRRLAFVRETVDTHSRCTRLEFFEAEGIVYEGVAFAPVVAFSWTDSCLVESHLTKSGKLFSPGKELGPNRIEYWLSHGRVVKIKSYYNGIRIQSKVKTNSRIEECAYLLMYSGCSKKTFLPTGVRF